jgi:hypothetical protein
MVEQNTAGAESDLQRVEQEVGYIGKVLRNASTYNGLAMIVAAGVLFHFVPATGSEELVKEIGAAGIALGGIIGVFIPN